MILVTGGAGYIGSHTVRELRERGMDVVVYDNLSTGHIESIGDTPFVKGDLFDVELLRKTFREYGVDSVIHFAAYSLVGESMVNPAKYYHNNVAGTLALLDAMLAENVKYLVFSSSAATYGDCGDGLITENSPQNPTSVYGQTKLMMEQFMQDYDKAYGMKYVALRYFNAAGAHASGEIGEAHNPESHLIPLILQVSNGKREQINIFGDDYPTHDGTCIRDYIHITDLADAHIKALEYLKNGGKSTYYNLGNGNGFSVKEVIDTVEKVVGSPVKKQVVERRPGDPASLVASSEKIQKELGWKPKYDTLDSIVASAWKWHSTHPDGFNK
ncbi:MAG: UDP-glucose 4-epimerase GalE [Clostridia bacterium]|mgnify:FL=1|nr:UDP-glucose 4-epimerase GalE [Clostridia bacterium]MBR2919471.1 UDP-glucose 4-epimerase GalE [Clostridia bacterium]